MPVLMNRTKGRAKGRQSFEVAWRTMSALVNAANDMLMAASPIQIPVRVGWGEKSPSFSPTPDGPSVLTPPPPGLWSLGGSFWSISGGGIVVAMGFALI